MKNHCGSMAKELTHIKNQEQDDVLNHHGQSFVGTYLVSYNAFPITVYIDCLMFACLYLRNDLFKQNFTFSHILHF